MKTIGAGQVDTHMEIIRGKEVSCSLPRRFVKLNKERNAESNETEKRLQDKKWKKSCLVS